MGEEEREQTRDKGQGTRDEGRGKGDRLRLRTRCHRTRNVSAAEGGGRGTWGRKRGNGRRTRDEGRGKGDEEGGQRLRRKSGKSEKVNREAGKREERAHPGCTYTASTNRTAWVRGQRPCSRARPESRTPRMQRRRRLAAAARPARRPRWHSWQTLELAFVYGSRRLRAPLKRVVFCVGFLCTSGACNK